MAGAPKGNQNGAKAKQWSAAVERALDKRSGSRAEALDALAEIFLSKCDDGDLTAFKELADRLDGKSHQSVDLSSDPDKPFITLIERVIVDPALLSK